MYNKHKNTTLSAQDIFRAQDVKNIRKNILDRNDRDYDCYLCRVSFTYEKKKYKCKFFSKH